MAEKTTLPFMTQYVGGLYGSLLDPNFADAFQSYKPQMYEQLFGKNGPNPRTLSETNPIGLYTQAYNPWKYLDQYYGKNKPGGVSAAEQNLLNTSLFGLTAPLDLSGPQAAAQNYSSMWGGGMGGGGGGMMGGVTATPMPKPSYTPKPTQAGMSWDPGKGKWVDVPAGGNPQLVYEGANNTFYINGQPVTDKSLYAPIMAGDWSKVPAHLQPTPPQSLFGATSADIFKSLGGQINMPTAPSLGAFQMPGMPAGLGGTFTPPKAPTLAPFKMPDAPTINVPGMMQSTYQQMLDAQPGLKDALVSSLNPTIALPEQGITDIMQSFGADPLMKAYVDSATQGMQQAYEKNLADQVLKLQSRFAGEGSYLSTPMFQGQAELTTGLTADHLSALGQMQLGAAESERNRQYAAATQQYNTEYERNALQVQIQAQQAANLAQEFGQMAQAAATSQGGIEQQLYANQLAALANEYATQADYLSSTYGSMVGAMASGFGTQQQALASMYGAQVGAAANAYGTQADFLSNLYNTGTNAALQQQNIVSNATQEAMRLLQTGQAASFDQAMKLATAQQGNQQSALDKLYASYYTPGANAMEILKTYFSLPSVRKTTGGGIFDDITGFVDAALPDSVSLA